MEHIVKKHVVINAEPGQVWDALTNPAKTKKYFYNCEVFSDWKVESEITFKGKIFLIKKIEMNGEIIQIEPRKYLKYTLENHDGADSTQSVVSELLSYHNGKTTLFVTDDVGIGPGAEKRFERSQKSWDKVLKGLKKVVEQGNA